MRHRRRLLRIGEYLVGLACRRLPRDVREERYREWAAELPAILDDPQVRFTPLRAVRMLGYAADTLRGTLGDRRRNPHLTAMLILLLLAGLVCLAGDIWSTVQAPGHGLNYVQSAWGLLLVAFPASMLVRSAPRVSTLIVICGTSAGLTVCLWTAAQAPGDWVNYLVAAGFCLALLILVPLLIGGWARRGRPQDVRTAK